MFVLGVNNENKCPSQGRVQQNNFVLLLSVPCMQLIGAGPGSWRQYGAATTAAA